MAQSDFVAAIKQIAAERGIDTNDVVEAIKHAIRIGFKKDYPEETAEALEIEIDLENGGIAAYADKKVVDEVTHPATQISLEDAQKIEKRLKVGDHIQVEVTHLGDFGRVAAQAARQVIVQLVRESEKEAIIKQFTDKIGTVAAAVVQRVDRDGNILLEINRALAKMPVEEQINGEFYRSPDVVKVFIKKIHVDAKGKIVLVSRADPNFLRALFEMEVPEIASGTVEIMEIAREAGSRSKVAVRSNAAGVDPIGSCVGQRGARINAITNEIKGPRTEEKIDIIPWDDDITKFIAFAIRPAEALEVKIIDERNRQALILVNDDDLSLAIGREGQNVRLAAKLTGWFLDIQGERAYREGGMISKFEAEGGKPRSKKLKMEDAARAEADAAKAEAAVDAEEETKTADVETEVVEAPATKKKATKAETDNTNGLESLNLSPRVVSALVAAGITTVGQLQAQMDSGEKIAGVGPKAMEEIAAAIK